MKKLTLTADARTIARAKRIADQRGTNLSGLFTDLIHAVETDRVKLGPKTRKATGLVKLAAGRSDRKLVQDAIAHRFKV